MMSYSLGVTSNSKLCQHVFQQFATDDNIIGKKMATSETHFSLCIVSVYKNLKV